MNNACQTKGQGKCDSGQMYNTTLRHFSTFGNDKVGMNEKEGGFFFLLAVRLLVQIFLFALPTFSMEPPHTNLCVYMYVYINYSYIN